MKQGDIAFFKAFLLHQKSNILNKSHEFKQSQREGHIRPAEEVESATLELNLNLSISLHEREQNMLFQIDKALSRIALGSFGNCDTCGCEIDQRRLKARPFAYMCVECTEDLEHAQPRR